MEKSTANLSFMFLSVRLEWYMRNYHSPKETEEYNAMSRSVKICCWVTILLLYNIKTCCCMVA